MKGWNNMPNIKPVSDLRNYYDVLSEVHENEPVYLTKNGRGAYAIITLDDYEAYERMKSCKELYNEIRKGVETDEREGYILEEDVKQKFGIK